MADNRYSNGKIYKLVNGIDDALYIGSTCSPLPKRLYEHKMKSKRKPEWRVYAHLNMVGWDNVQIVLIQELSCNNKMELLRQERKWIEELMPALNKYIPCRTHEEHKLVKAVQDKTYRENNKDKVREMKHQYRQSNKDKIAKHQKEYRDANKEQINARRKETYEQTKDHIAEKAKQKTICECGCEVRKYDLSRHKKSKTHQQWLASQPSTSST